MHEFRCTEELGIVHPAGSASTKEEGPRAGPSWIVYLRGIFSYVIVKAFVDLTVSIILVLALYLVALALIRLLPSESAPQAVQLGNVSIIVGLFYVLAVMVTATVRFCRFLRRDLM